MPNSTSERNLQQSNSKSERKAAVQGSEGKERGLTERVQGSSMGHEGGAGSWKWMPATEPCDCNECCRAVNVKILYCVYFTQF